MPTEEAVATPVESSAPAAEVPSAPESPQIQDNPDLSSEQFISQALEKLSKPEEQSAEVQLEPVAESPAEETAVAEVPDVEKPAEPDKQPEEEEQGLDLTEPLAAQELEAKINANAEFKASLEKDPALRNELFKNARLASETHKYREIFPDHESAKVAASDAAMFREADAAFYSGDPKNFVDALVKMATVTDANGQAMRDANGFIQIDPALTNVYNYIGQNEMNFRLDSLRKEAEKDGDERTLAALEVLKERLSPTSSAEEELPESLRATAAQIKAEKEAWTRQQAEQQQAQLSTFFNSIIETVDVQVNKVIDSVLSKAALTDFAKNAARKEIHDRLAEALAQNTEYQSRKRAYDGVRTPSDDVKGKYVSLVTSHANAVLPSIVREVMKEAGNPVIAAQQAKDAKIAAQQTRSQQELRGAATPATQKPLEGQALLDKISADYKKEHNGEDIDNYTLLFKANEYKQNLRRAVANR